MDKLTQKQYDFTINYIKNGCNLYQAAIDAGYSPMYAKTRSAQLIKNPEVNKRLSKAFQDVQLEQHKALCMTIADKARVLDRIIREIVPLDENIPIKLGYVRDAIKAISELNKMSGDYAPDKRINLTVEATQNRLIEAKQAYEEY